MTLNIFDRMDGPGRLRDEINCLFIDCMDWASFDFHANSNGKNGGYRLTAGRWAIEGTETVVAAWRERDLLGTRPVGPE